MTSFPDASQMFSTGLQPFVEATNLIIGNFDDYLVGHLPRTIKAICNIGSGINNIDLQSCTQRDINVTNTPSAGKDAVADATMFLLLGALRRASGHLTRVRQGHWQQDTAVGQDAQGRVLGPCGFGSIGSTVAKRAKALGMTVQYYSPSSERNRYSTPDSYIEAGFRSVSFHELLSTSDVISMHAPLTATTHHLFSRSEFEKMKKSVVIINTARGLLVDQDALIDAVKKGHVWAAGMNVFEEEPVVPEAIRSDERFFVMPHVATKTVGARMDMERCMIRNLTAVMNGDQPPDVVGV